jgi:hypothetical protein
LTEPRPTRCCGSRASEGLRLALCTPGSSSNTALRRELSMYVAISRSLRRTVALVDTHCYLHLLILVDRPPFACTPDLARGLETGRFARSAFRLPSAEARRLFCVSSAHPNGGGAAPFGLCPVLPAENDRPQTRPATHSSRRALPVLAPSASSAPGARPGDGHRRRRGAVLSVRLTFIFHRPPLRVPGGMRVWW